MTLLCLCISIISTPLLARRNRTQRHPLFPPAIFAQRSFTIGAAGSALCQVGFFSIYFGLPLYMREVWSWSPLKIVCLIPLNVVPLLTAAVAGKKVDRQGTRPIIIFGGIWSGVFLIIGFPYGSWIHTICMTFQSRVRSYGNGNNTTIATLLDIEDGPPLALLCIIHSATPWISPRSSFDSVHCREPVGFRFQRCLIWVWILERRLPSDL